MGLREKLRRGIWKRVDNPLRRSVAEVNNENGSVAREMWGQESFNGRHNGMFMC